MTPEKRDSAAARDGFATYDQLRGAIRNGSRLNVGGDR
jgi:hypothetical protein